MNELFSCNIHSVSKEHTFPDTEPRNVPDTEPRNVPDTEPRNVPDTEPRNVPDTEPRFKEDSLLLVVFHFPLIIISLILPEYTS